MTMMIDNVKVICQSWRTEDCVGMDIDTPIYPLRPITDHSNNIWATQQFTAVFCETDQRIGIDAGEGIDWYKGKTMSPKLLEYDEQLRSLLRGNEATVGNESDLMIAELKGEGSILVG